MPGRRLSAAPQGPRTTNAFSSKKPKGLKAVIYRLPGGGNIMQSFVNERYSGHGLHRLVESRSWLRKSTWAVLCVLFVVFMVLQCIDIIEEYYTYPKKTNIEEVAKTKITFPAVTICNQNPIDKNKVRQFHVSSYYNYRPWNASTVMPSDMLWRLYQMEMLFQNNLQFGWSDKCSSFLNAITCNNEIDGVTCTPPATEQKRKRSIETDDKEVTEDGSEYGSKTLKNLVFENISAEEYGNKENVYLDTVQDQRKKSANTATTSGESKANDDRKKSTESLHGDRKKRQTTDDMDPPLATLLSLKLPAELKHLNATMDNFTDLVRKICINHYDFLWGFTSECIPFFKNEHEMLTYWYHKKLQGDAAYDGQYGPYGTAGGYDWYDYTDYEDVASIHNYYPDLEFLNEVNTADLVQLLVVSQTDDLSDFRSWMPLNELMLEVFGYQFDDIIKECTFNGVKCTEKDFYRRTNAKYGSCYTFNSGFNRETPLKKTTRFGTQNGLKLTLNAASDKYLNILTPEFGFRVEVHDPNVIPFPEDEGNDVPLKNKCIIGVHEKHYERAGPPHGDCRKKRWEYKGDYTQFGCRKICNDNVIKKKCGCTNLVEDVGQHINDDVYYHLCDTLDVDQMVCLNATTKLLQGEDLCPECKAACNETKFESTFSISARNLNYHKIRSVAMEMRDEKKCRASQKIVDVDRFISNDFSDLHVYMQSLNVEVIKESPAFNTLTVISNLGGILGLCMGVSVMTLLEIIEFVYDVLTGYWMRRKSVEDENAGDALHAEEVIIEYPDFNFLESSLQDSFVKKAMDA